MDFAHALCAGQAMGTSEPPHHHVEPDPDHAILDTLNRALQALGVVDARNRVGWRRLPAPCYGAEKSRKMLSIATPTPVRPRRHRWQRLILVGLLISLLPLAPQRPVTATAPSGLSNRDWQAIQAQLPASVTEDYLKSASPESLDFFGNAVAVAGDTVVVGVYGEDSDGSSPANNSASGSGAAYVFVRSSPAAQRAPSWEPAGLPQGCQCWERRHLRRCGGDRWRDRGGRRTV